MKINPMYSLKSLGGKSIIISENTMHLDGILTLNDTAEFIWHKIEEGAETEEIVSLLADECNVLPDDIRTEVYGFINKLKTAGIIE